MPKVYLTEKDRLCARLAAWVYGQMKLHRISQRALAPKMGISHQALSKKLKTHNFNYTDFVFFIQEFQPTDGELRQIIGI